MHDAAFDYVRSSVSELGAIRSVVELGARDLNGSVRPLFDQAETYVGLDVAPGAGVDVVFDPAEPWLPPELVDVVVSCEVLEHVEDWPSVLRHAAAMLRPGGWLVLTAAGPGRTPHSGITGRKNRLEPGEHYGNVSPADLEDELELAGFDLVDVELVGADVRARARRRTPLVVGIPFLDLYDETRSVIEAVLEDPLVDLLILDDNGSSDRRLLELLDRLESDERVVVHHRPRLSEKTSLYTLWNAYVDEAHRLGANVAILNNDVRLAPRTLSHLSRALVDAPADVAAVYPDWRRPLSAGVEVSGALERSSGTWRAGGLSGFAFAVRAALVEPLGPIPRFDERYAWISGDGDFVEGLEFAGFTAARVLGLPLEHDKSTTATSFAWTRRAKRADVERRKAKVAAREAAS